MSDETTTQAKGPHPIPSSILIVGSGAFGLSTAWALATRPDFAATRITLVDRVTSLKDGDLPSSDAASMDSSRIVRADYADALYARLGVEAQKAWRGGMAYVRGSLANVMDIAKEQGYADRIVEVGTGEELRALLGTAEKPGDWGYLNKTSGWADATRGMEWVLEKVKATGRDGAVLEADLVVVAAGAWTGGLVDLRGLVTATGHVLAYMDLSDEEQAALADMPVVLNLGSGLFVIPPRNNVLKAARHAFGYLNPVDLPAAKLLPKEVPQETDGRAEDGTGAAGRDGDDGPGSTIRISAPRTAVDAESIGLPLEAETDLRRSLRQFIPVEALHDRPGHAYKFLPVLGGKIVDCIAGRGDEAVRRKWRWREGKVSVVEGIAAVVTEDGSRGGSPGKILERELARTE
ncbi:unnamed protein product [Parascedosporium putredinis]|uniref:FAD dependent oxidoreductase domain-containing protein n=1 Tax=Parascedosporium putredinis TaxID=1442378 RepID=A0A9P1MF95_9PEZI|nr:unnamed protein product [Parascedosporium putredinis]CAI8004579.1 unnamed protein product [Parascedosporium putredinis]